MESEKLWLIAYIILTIIISIIFVYFGSDIFSTLFISMLIYFIVYICGFPQCPSCVFSTILASLFGSCIGRLIFKRKTKEKLLFVSCCFYLIILIMSLMVFDHFFAQQIGFLCAVMMSFAFTAFVYWSLGGQTLFGNLDPIPENSRPSSSLNFGRRFKIGKN